ncbi:MAG: SSU ribosomal protein S14p (S29e) @ SSU ribosomal protein S14p (S29e), zinc-dependent, partial [uncultured Rubrobacteraceae bacterium]
DEESVAGQAAEAAEVQGQGVQPVPAVRPGPRLLPEVRAVQDLPARAGPRGQDPRCHESELV